MFKEFVSFIGLKVIVDRIVLNWQPIGNWNPTALPDVAPNWSSGQIQKV
jgi:hypothetical protein